MITLEELNEQALALEEEDEAEALEISEIQWERRCCNCRWVPPDQSYQGKCPRCDHTIVTYSIPVKDAEFEDDDEEKWTDSDEIEELRNDLNDAQGLLLELVEVGNKILDPRWHGVPARFDLAKLAKLVYETDQFLGQWEWNDVQEGL